MKKLPLMLVALGCFGALGQSAAKAQETVVVEKAPKRNLNDGYDHYYNKHRARQVYVIEDHHPVRRTVFIDGRGRYYRVIEGQRVFIDRHYDEYPTQYFYRDGRVRPGVSIVF